MDNHNGKVWGIILAGGEGRRLQSFIRLRYGSDTPKQYCTFTGTRSMLRHTIDRAEMLIQPERLFTIVSNQHSRYAQSQLADRPSGTVIVQPVKRETGPAILYLLLHVYQRDPEAIVCVFPSDHFVLNEQCFIEHIQFSAEFVTGEPQSIMLLGVHPQQPEAGYGWIVTSEQTPDNNAKRVYHVSQFVEKPDAFTAYRLYREGGLWNTMIIVSKARTLLTSFKLFAPSLYQAFWDIRDVLGTSREARIAEEVYSKLPSTNFSYSILEKIPIGLRAVKMQGVYWNDWGDAARIQSDIQRFCAAKAPSNTPLPFARFDHLPVRSQSEAKAYNTKEERT